MGEKQLPVYTITRSHSEKFQHEFAGGKRYESSDSFSSHSYSFFREPGKEEIEQVSTMLYARAKEDVFQDIEMRKAELRIANSRRTKAIDNEAIAIANGDLNLGEETPSL